MRTAHDETLHLRLPAALRADLDGAARAVGGKLSPVARRALEIGLRTIRATDDRDPPPPAAPACAIPVAA